MIRELTESEVKADFLALISNIEAGTWFDIDNPPHVQWLERAISRRDPTYRKRLIDFFEKALQTSSNQAAQEG